MNAQVVKKRQDYFDSELGARLRTQLEEMESDSRFNTEAGYSADAELYPDHIISFVDKHLSYLYAHPALEPMKYIANLRLMTRKR